MKFTEKFFSFPIKIYDGFSLEKALKEEEVTDEPKDADWISGTFKLPASELASMAWHDGFSRNRNVEEVAKEGFDITVICSNSYGDMTCMWPRKKFEEKLNEFYEKLETTINDKLPTNEARETST